MTDTTKFRLAIAGLVVALLLGALYAASILMKSPRAGLAVSPGATADDPAAAAASRAMTFSQPKAPKP